MNGLSSAGRFSRRDLLKTGACGFGYLALADLCARAAAAESHAVRWLAKAPHFKPGPSG